MYELLPSRKRQIVGADSHMIFRIVALAAFLLCLAGGPALAQQAKAAAKSGKSGQQAQDKDVQGIPYTAELQGDVGEELRALVTGSLDTFTLQQKPPRTKNLLRRRMEDDLPTLKKILSSRGYFKGKIETALTQGQEGLLAVFTVQPGPRFRFGELRIAPTPKSDPKAPLPAPAAVGLERGAPYTAKAVLDAQSAILKALGQGGYPFPQIADRKVIANHDTNEVSVTFSVVTGPKSGFGETTISGLEHVEPAYAQHFIPWEKGQQFDERLLDKARARLVQTGLFSMATFEKQKITEDGLTPIHIKIVERKPRTVRAGLRYRTDTGIGGKVEWEHRTLLGNGERFHASLDADQVKQELMASFRKPTFMDDDLSLLVEQRITRERDDAYDGESSQTSAGVEYQLGKNLTLGAGVAYRLSRVKDDDEDEETFGLLSFPAFLSWDSRNDLLNPTRGWRFNLSGAPYVDTLGTSSHFVQLQTSFTHYMRLIGEDTLIFATRGMLGTTQGAGLDEVPKDIRFYAGGGNSVRGFAYRMAGDLDSDDNPVGGRSVFEATGELRWRFLGDFGLVAFTDVGRAYADTFPDLDQELFIGAGMGLRYYSFVGPVGVDVAIPLNPRDADDRYQIYVSLGQSF